MLSRAYKGCQGWVHIDHKKTQSALMEFAGVEACMTVYARGPHLSAETLRVGHGIPPISKHSTSNEK
jgi:hypothetical protein